MHFGLNMVPVRLGELTDAAQRAEALGFESLWVGEHILTPVAVAPKYPGATGKPPFSPDSRFTEPFATLAHLGAVTSRVRLGTGIAILPLHAPLALARSIATVDVLSGGRVSVGVGVGWMREEFDAVGQDFTTRGRRMDEMLAVLDTLFTEERPSFAGEFYTLPEMGFQPKPLQRPRPPMLVGGSSEVALRRAARAGDGWYGGQQPPEEVVAIIEKLQRYREEYERADRPFEITVLTAWGKGYDADLVAGYEKAGVHRMVATPWSSSREALAGIEAFARTAGLASEGAR
ncbi:TIGR03619 family F420-dependent LLM class oxidoreductase [Cryptosporangium aurantiacum]|uniref:Probable F420-dependent oxidoreductase, Rv2161c family n=1 Tax=Cryptosporangium aurantiacum TaxID=134849 RepID=A0A1M7R487_9ACTN|nr:TIGR03619 family F420-dependent LLM class oxidoreductase [Cryptosporangium aurantiacum]SHN39877.1 probable F420-dependent oxidoreductase, Rv2161c family [Cryptosporangium aurantiacum]